MPESYSPWRHCLIVAIFWMTAAVGVSGAERPNVILIMADDMGAADWEGGGSRFIRTPNINQLADDGVVLTNFYASANVCTPSRAGLLTGRYAARSGLAHGVIQPWSDYGLPPTELTLAELLRDAGYATQLVGKWHLGTVPGSHPLDHGFDAFFGVPYSNDMRPFPLIRGREVIEASVDQRTLTRRYTRAVSDFVAEKAREDRPFFIYLAHTFPHVPLFASETFAGESAAGGYGDTIEELDWSLGAIRTSLRDAGVEDNTLIVFTSDNGPWFQGESGRRGRKGDSYDGAYRVPFLAYLPGTTGAGAQSAGMAMNIDLLPTIAALADIALPQDLTLDGLDISPLLAGGQDSPHEELLFFINSEVAALRTPRWRYVVKAYYRNFLVPLENYGAALLFDLTTHGDELYDVSDANPAVVEELAGRLAKARTEFEELPQQVTPFPRPTTPEP